MTHVKKAAGRAAAHITRARRQLRQTAGLRPLSRYLINSYSFYKKGRWATFYARLILFTSAVVE